MTQEHMAEVQRLWLVRHGATQWNSEQRFCGHSDIPLALEGRRQALWLAHRLHLEPVTMIYTSDLLRARQTAEIIAAHHSSPVQIRVSSDWRELAFGDWEGLTYTQIAQQFASYLDFFTDPVHHAPPNGESLIALLERTQRGFRTMRDEAVQEQGVVLVSHGGPLRVLLCNLLGMPLERQWQLRLDPGSLSALDCVSSLEETDLMTTLALLNTQRPAHTQTS